MIAKSDDSVNVRSILFTVAIQKELFGGYHHIYEQNSTKSDIERCVAPNQLTAEQFYDLILRHGARIAEERADTKPSNTKT